MLQIIALGNCISNLAGSYNCLLELYIKLVLNICEIVFLLWLLLLKLTRILTTILCYAVFLFFIQPSIHDRTECRLTDRAASCKTRKKATQLHPYPFHSWR